MKKILICTGGTGGHIFPAISLAKYLEKKNQIEWKINTSYILELHLELH